MHSAEGFPGGSAGKESACSAGDLGSIPGLGRSPGEGKGYPLQYPGLENSMDESMGLQRVGHDRATFSTLQEESEMAELTPRTTRSWIRVMLSLGPRRRSGDGATRWTRPPVPTPPAACAAEQGESAGPWHSLASRRWPCTRESVYIFLGRVPASRYWHT